MNYLVDFTDEARADLARMFRNEPKAYKKAEKLIAELEVHPRTGTGHPHQLSGDHAGQWSRSITKKHRLVYTINDNEVIVLVLMSWGHYDDK